MKNARDVMHKNVISVTPTQSIVDVARTLNENEISGAPVVDFNGTLRGIVSRTNILDHALLSESEAVHPVIRLLIPGTTREDEVYAPASDLDSIPEAQDVMSEEVITVEPMATVYEVARLMNSERIHRVPVVDGGRVVGIITSLDLLGAFPEAATNAAASS